MDHETTIVAISSPGGQSSHALIRATGPNAWSGAQILGVAVEPRTIKRAHIQIHGHSVPVMVTGFAANASFTGQETVEIQLVNNTFLVETILKAMITATNGRFAEAGEFTARAFLHGNISLSSAEGVCATISANNDAELAGAALLRNGALAKASEPISEEIIRVLALVEAGIDFTDEEDVVAISETELRAVLSTCKKQIEHILDGKIAMETLVALPTIVIAGKPNAGKSTLFNRLLNKKRVVVSNISGTTRDAITERTRINGQEVLLVDVAGLEDTNNALGVSMQSSANKAIESATIVLWCVAPKDNIPNTSNLSVVVHTKKDMNGSHEDAINAQTGEGIDALQSKIENALTGYPVPSVDALVLLPRHTSYLEVTRGALQESIEQLHTPELVAASLRDALNAVGAVTGHVTPDEIIGEVFSSFCIGK